MEAPGSQPLPAMTVRIGPKHTEGGNAQSSLGAGLPGGPVDKNLSAKAGDLRSTPGPSTRIPACHRATKLCVPETTEPRHPRSRCSTTREITRNEKPVHHS